MLDTNVLVSGLLSPAGAPGWIVDLVLAGEIQPVFDGRILEEYRAVLLRPELRLPAGEVQALVENLERLGWKVTAPPWPHKLPDPADEPFLAVAAHAGAMLVTGNLRHFPARLREGVSVLTPRELLEAWPPRSGAAPEGT